MARPPIPKRVVVPQGKSHPYQRNRAGQLEPDEAQTFSPPETGLKVRHPKGRRITNLGIVTRFRKAPTDA